ncbi:MAG: biotin-dependent carboxyltransferase family protein [Ilumatobacteraceae bacterium]
MTVLTARLEVTAWGIAGSVVDLGVVGRGWLGAPRGGAVDPGALRLGNRLVGSDEAAAGLETSGGLEVRVLAPVTMVCTGAVAEVAVTGGPPMGWGSPVTLPAGAVVRVVRVVDGLRSYLAIRGGVSAGGSLLGVGPEPSARPSLAAAVPQPRRTTARIWPGPRLDLFDASAWHALTSAPFTVSSASRVGVRLEGPRLERRMPVTLASEGLVEGAVQVPPDGLPIVMLADPPTTGGYPVAAVVDRGDLEVLAQAAPGSSVRFVDATARPKG